MFVARVPWMSSEPLCCRKTISVFSSFSSFSVPTGVFFQGCLLSSARFTHRVKRGLGKDAQSLTAANSFTLSKAAFSSAPRHEIKIASIELNLLLLLLLQRACLLYAFASKNGRRTAEEEERSASSVRKRRGRL